MKIKLLALAILFIPATACAGASVDRRAYILAHPHGWVELTIFDSQVPDIPPRRDDGEWGKLGDCSVHVYINSEPLLRDSAYPDGEAAPYVVDTGFRFPAPVGDSDVGLNYVGCRVEDEEKATVDSSTTLRIEEDQMHELRFDGSSLSALAPVPNEVITLEDVYEAVTGSANKND
jgi:hypothetical protein